MCLVVVQAGASEHASKEAVITNVRRVASMPRTPEGACGRGARGDVARAKRAPEGKNEPRLYVRARGGVGKGSDALLSGTRTRRQFFDCGYPGPGA